MSFVKEIKDKFKSIDGCIRKYSPVTVTICIYAAVGQLYIEPLVLPSNPASNVYAQSTEPALFISTYPNATQGKITSFTIGVDGTLNMVGVYNTSDTGPQTIDISPDGRFLAVAHGTANSIEEHLDIFAVNPDATLTMVLTELVPNSPLDVVWLRDDLLAVTETVFPSTLGIYYFDDSVYTLTEIDRKESGSFNTNIICNPHGRFVHASDSVGNNIYAFEISDSDGTITLASTTSTGGFYPLGMGLSHDGKYLYAGAGISNDGHTVHGYAVDVDNAGLTPLPGSPYYSNGTSPKSAVVSTDDKYVYAAHGSDATVRAFRLENDGSLTRLVYAFDIGLQGTLGEIVMYKDYMFVTDNSTAVDGISGVYSFKVNASDGSFNMVGGGIYDTGTSTPNTMVAWNPDSGMYLKSSPLIAGQHTTFSVKNCKPQRQTGLLYSLKGGGHSTLSQYGISLGLDAPITLINIKNADVAGYTEWMLPIPMNSQNKNVWLQAAQYGKISNVIARYVQ